MKNLRSRFERFCYRNRNKGIPNLMLFVIVASAIVYLISEFTGNYVLYELLCFDRQAILDGQVWRLITYAITHDAGNLLMTLIAYLCYYSIGRGMENTWGTFRFNLFYFTGIILMDAYTMVLGGEASIYYLNLSLFLGYATMYPDARFLLLFIIPIKARIFALIYLLLAAMNLFTLPFPDNLFTVVALANYFLFFGKDVLNVIPPAWRINARRLARKSTTQPKQNQRSPIQFYQAGSYEATTTQAKAPYTHRCTVCGRTDVTNPELEFRYCSRCNGYHCYCEEHISNHAHIE